MSGRVPEHNKWRVGLRLIVRNKSPGKYRPRGLMVKALDFGSHPPSSLEIPGSTPGVVVFGCFFFAIHTDFICGLEGVRERFYVLFLLSVNQPLFLRFFPLFMTSILCDLRSKPSVLSVVSG